MAESPTGPVIGWEKQTPVPDGYQFNDYLHVQNGHLYMEDLDLAALFLGGESPLGGKPFASPMEVVYLPLIRRQIERMCGYFAEVSAEIGYEGRFLRLCLQGQRRRRSGAHDARRGRPPRDVVAHRRGHRALHAPPRLLRRTGWLSPMASSPPTRCTTTA